MWLLCFSFQKPHIFFFLKTPQICRLPIRVQWLLSLSTKRFLQNSIFFLSSYTWGHIYSFYHTLNSFFPIAPNERTHKRCYIFTRRMKLYGAKLFSQMVLIFKELLVPDKYWLFTFLFVLCTVDCFRHSLAVDRVIFKKKKKKEKQV